MKNGGALKTTSAVGSVDLVVEKFMDVIDGEEVFAVHQNYYSVPDL